MNQCDLEETKLLAVAKLRELVKKPEGWGRTSYGYTSCWRNGEYRLHSSYRGHGAFATLDWIALPADAEGLLSELAITMRKHQDAKDCATLLAALNPRPRAPDPLEPNIQTLWQRFRHHMWVRYGL